MAGSEAEVERLRDKLYRRDVALARINSCGALDDAGRHMIGIAREQMPDLDDDERVAIRAALGLSAR
jgi:hypothetical protein